MITSGQTAGDTSENGRTTTCMGMEYTHGVMVGDMMATTLMTKSMGLESTHGQMAVSTTACGSMESSTEKVNTYYQTEKPRKDYGSRERDKTGLTINHPRSQSQSPS